VTRALVALGSNLGDREALLDSAVAELSALPKTRCLAVSSWHATAPVDAPPGSPPFLNGAVLLETKLSPDALLERLQQIEHAHQRVREVANGPRTLDLDLVLHGDAQRGGPELTLPHPRAHERAFVLIPAAEVAPEMLHPGLGRTLGELRNALPTLPLATGLGSALESGEAGS
jgi:2-amino-4-hydroxy-6-hydroxymethyldihydropteridine diphosphokinase